MLLLASVTNWFRLKKTTPGDNTGVEKAHTREERLVDAGVSCGRVEMLYLRAVGLEIDYRSILHPVWERLAAS